MKNIQLIEGMISGMVSNGGVNPSEIVTALHNVMAFGKLHIDAFGHVNEPLLTQAFIQLDRLINTLRQMEM